MVEVCREFLRRRVVKEVWPHLIGQLESLATKSTNPDKLYRWVVSVYDIIDV